MPSKSDRTSHPHCQFRKAPGSINSSQVSSLQPAIYNIYNIYIYHIYLIYDIYVIYLLFIYYYI